MLLLLYLKGNRQTSKNETLNKIGGVRNPRRGRWLHRPGLRAAGRAVSAGGHGLTSGTPSNPPALPPTLPSLGSAPSHLPRLQRPEVAGRTARSEGGLILHCTDEEPEEEEPRRCSQDDSPEAATGCPGAGQLRIGAEQRPHRHRPALSSTAPLPAAPAPPAEPRRCPARPGGGGGSGSGRWSRPRQRLPPRLGRLTRNPGTGRQGSALSSLPIIIASFLLEETLKIV